MTPAKQTPKADRPKKVGYECGICSQYHPALWDGDCRDDANRYSDPDVFSELIEMEDVDAWRAAQRVPSHIVESVQGAMIEFGPDGHIDGAREIAVAALEASGYWELLAACKLAHSALMGTPALDMSHRRDIDAAKSALLAAMHLAEAENK